MNPRSFSWAPGPLKSEVPIDLLERLDVRVGKIEAVDDVPGSHKLVELRVDFGDHQRRIIVGMKRERPNPREIEGLQALFVVNLPPRRIMGRVSEGMLLDIGHSDGLMPVLAVPEKPVPSGARAG
jgi:tRNA-binding protein